MLMIGSTGRNSGKTTFAIEGIRRWKAEYPVIALKVTAVDDPSAACPRGGDGCGACSSLRGNYEISEELDPGTAKDTSQLLKSGALRVYWLKSRRTHLSQGIEDFLRLLPPKTLVICESNSLRHAVKPGAFVMLHNTGGGRAKITAQNVLHYADRVIEKDIRIHAGEVLHDLAVEEKNGQLTISFT